MTWHAGLDRSHPLRVGGSVHGRALALLAALLVACGGTTATERGPAPEASSPSATPTVARATAAPTAARTVAPTAAPAVSAAPAGFAGTWRVYSERLFYDVGGAGPVVTTNFQTLTLGSDSTWTYGSSKGTFSVGAIVPSDWTRWGSNPYGPTRKITLAGWNGSSADGPVDESTRVDFVWVIYRVGPPDVSAPGAVHMKFGH